MELNICHLYPDVLNLYGDTGNILCCCLRYRAGVPAVGSSLGYVDLLIAHLFCTCLIAELFTAVCAHPVRNMSCFCTGRVLF